jgi:hypothetical protein
MNIFRLQKKYQVRLIKQLGLHFHEMYYVILNNMKIYLKSGKIIEDIFFNFTKDIKYKQ